MSMPQSHCEANGLSWGVSLSPWHWHGVTVFIAPQYYRSETLIVAEEQNRLDNFVKGAGEGNFEQQLFIIQRQILSQDFLGEIVREFNPYPDDT